MTLFTKFVRYTDYLGVRLAAAEIDEREAEAAFEVSKAKYVIAAGSGLQTAREEAKVDPEVMELQSTLDTATAYRKLMKVVFDAAERDAALVSRELTRRVGRAEVSDRRHSRFNP